MSFSLSHKVELFVPSRRQDGTPIDEQSRTEAKLTLGRKFSEAFGGASLSEVLGFFKHASGEIATEQVSVVWSFVAELDANVRSLLDANAHELKEKFSQESVMYTIDGTAYFIE